MAENVLYLRSDDDNEENDDPWDDTLLMRAYETAFDSVKKSLKKEGKTQSSKKFKVGDYCRAKYSEDGVIYEAVVSKILADGSSCIVKYCGYGNEERQSLKDLRPSKGKDAREQQVQLAETTQVEWEECVESSSDTDLSFRPVKPVRRQKAKKDEMHMPPPPPPPPPPEFFSNTGNNPDSNQAFHAMLMSWYMSGYHTGYYEALKSKKK